MMRAPETDFWQAGVVPLPINACLNPANLAGVRGQIRWLPPAGPWRYLADPFGVQRDGATHVFVEAFDYRDKHGVIEHHELGPDGRWRGGATVLARPFHLSYPYLVEQGGEVFMVPESHQARELALYRARTFPDDWVKETVLLAGIPAVDASIVAFGGRWWMFFSIAGTRARDQRELHAAWADALTGPWRLHRRSPLLEDRGGARPGGTPFVGADGRLILPVQNCADTYGGGLAFLRCVVIEPDRIVLERLPEQLCGGHVSRTHQAGLHTLASCGRQTLIDVKHIARTRARHWIDWKRRLARIRGRMLG